MNLFVRIIYFFYILFIVYSIKKLMPFSMVILVSYAPNIKKYKKKTLGQNRFLSKTIVSFLFGPIETIAISIFSSSLIA